MSRYSHLDTDEERLPEGMSCVGYDSDTQIYTYQDADGEYWESAPGCRYGRMTRVGQDADDDADDSQPFIADHYKTNWRNDLGPFLNFGVLIGVSMLLFFWYLHVSAGSSSSNSSASHPAPACSAGSSAYTVREGDTCWDLGQANNMTVDDILALNENLDCGSLKQGASICLPA